MNTIVEKVLGTLLVCILYPIWFAIGSNGSIRFTLQEDVAVSYTHLTLPTN